MFSAPLKIKSFHLYLHPWKDAHIFICLISGIVPESRLLKWSREWRLTIWFRRLTATTSWSWGWRSVNWYPPQNVQKNRKSTKWTSYSLLLATLLHPKVPCNCFMQSLQDEKFHEFHFEFGMNLTDEIIYYKRTNFLWEKVLEVGKSSDFNLVVLELT